MVPNSQFRTPCRRAFIRRRLCLGKMRLHCFQSSASAVPHSSRQKIQDSRLNAKIAGSSSHGESYCRIHVGTRTAKCVRVFSETKVLRYTGVVVPTRSLDHRQSEINISGNVHSDFVQLTAKKNHVMAVFCRSPFGQTRTCG